MGIAEMTRKPDWTVNKDIPVGKGAKMWSALPYSALP
jgi:hypothetical protein